MLSDRVYKKLLKPQYQLYRLPKQHIFLPITKTNFIIYKNFGG